MYKYKLYVIIDPRHNECGAHVYQSNEPIDHFYTDDYLIIVIDGSNSVFPIDILSQVTYTSKFKY